jgi:NAD(P)-dependent dehydrogenase (short-subunit alcohol dehydrogenase family)
MGRLSGRVVIVTGAAQGIGAVYARGLAAEGARVSVCDLADPAATVAAIQAAGGEALGQIADVTSPEAMSAFVNRTERAFGAVHVLINNAAIFGHLRPKPFTEISSLEWDQVMAANIRGPFECIKAVVPIMRRQHYGKIINIASGTVFKGTPMLLHYVTSKGAMVTMTRCLARELGDDGIAVNCIAPGLTMSENVRARSNAQGIAANIATRCFKREEEPQDLVGTMIFLASAESDFITGQTLVVDGGSALN